MARHRQHHEPADEPETFGQVNSEPEGLPEPEVVIEPEPEPEAEPVEDIGPIPPPEPGTNGDKGKTLALVTRKPTPCGARKLQPDQLVAVVQLAPDISVNWLARTLADKVVAPDPEQRSGPTVLVTRKPLTIGRSLVGPDTPVARIELAHTIGIDWLAVAINDGFVGAKKS